MIYQDGYVECDGCKAKLDLDMDARKDISLLALAAKAMEDAGWGLCGRWQDLCPECLEKRRGENAKRLAGLAPKIAAILAPVPPTADASQIRAVLEAVRAEIDMLDRAL